MAEQTLTLFNIQRYSLHDGDGIRTVFFLKGCPLRCRWCCNPESQNPLPEVMFRKNACIGMGNCGRCAAKFNTDSDKIFDVDSDGRCKPNIPLCSQNLSCCDVCPAGALHVVGKEYTISSLLDIAEKDAAFYGEEGGITLSGGEPLAQEGSIEFLRRAKTERYLTTAIETCGEVPAERLLEASKYLDHIFMDIKSVDRCKHLLYTGSDGSRIRDNLRQLSLVYPQEQITIRTPVIPGFNDRPEDLAKIEEFLAQFPGVTWEKLPYHKYGVGKYEMLGRKYPLGE